MAVFVLLLWNRHVVFPLGDLVTPNANGIARCPSPSRAMRVCVPHETMFLSSSPPRVLHRCFSSHPRSRTLRGGALQQHLAAVVPPAGGGRVQCHTSSHFSSVISWSNRLSEIRLHAGAAPRHHRATCTGRVMEPGSAARTCRVPLWARQVGSRPASSIPSPYKRGERRTDMSAGICQARADMEG